MSWNSAPGTRQDDASRPSPPALTLDSRAQPQPPAVPEPGAPSEGSGDRGAEQDILSDPGGPREHPTLCAPDVSLKVQLGSHGNPQGLPAQASPLALHLPTVAREGVVRLGSPC